MYINSERSDIDLQRAIKRYIRGELCDEITDTLSYILCFFNSVVQKCLSTVYRMMNFAFTGDKQERRWPILGETRGIAHSLVL